MSQEDPPAMRRGRVARTAPLVLMTGRAAGESIVASLRRRTGGDTTQTQARTAENFAAHLGHSKGMLMKAGQILSFSALGSTLLDEHKGVYARAFARLQEEAPPMPFDTVSEVVAREFGRPLEAVFAEFEPNPVGAASIGQVHAARLTDGRQVAVKVQYPGVDEAIRSDLANTKLLAAFLQMGKSSIPGLRQTDVTALAREVSERIGDEIDYRVEAEYQQAFAAAYRGHAFIRVPEVIPELSTSRVLTQDFAGGLRYAEAITADADLRDSWGEAVYRFAIGSVRRIGLFNADPHPGNYRFNPDGSVTFLDFGCVKRYPAHLVRAMQIGMSAAIDGDADALIGCLRDTGALAATTTLDPAAALHWFRSGLDLLTQPQPYEFSTQDVAAAVGQKFSLTGPHGAVIRQLNMPPDMLMMMRIELGMYGVLAGLRATGRWEAIRGEWDRNGEPATPMGVADQAFWGAKAA